MATTVIALAPYLRLYDEYWALDGMAWYRSLSSMDRGAVIIVLGGGIMFDYDLTPLEEAELEERCGYWKQRLEAQSRRRSRARWS